jgi:hypothetical protein
MSSSGSPVLVPAARRQQANTGDRATTGPARLACSRPSPIMAPVSSNFCRCPPAISCPLPLPLSLPPSPPQLLPPAPLPLSHCTLACGAGENVAPPSCDSNSPAGKGAGSATHATHSRVCQGESGWFSPRICHNPRCKHREAAGPQHGWWESSQTCRWQPCWQAQPLCSPVCGFASSAASRRNHSRRTPSPEAGSCGLVGRAGQTGR